MGAIGCIVLNSDTVSRGGGLTVVSDGRLRRSFSFLSLPQLNLTTDQALSEGEPHPHPSHPLADLSIIPLDTTLTDTPLPNPTHGVSAVEDLPRLQGEVSSFHDSVSALLQSYLTLTTQVCAGSWWLHVQHSATASSLPPSLALSLPPFLPLYLPLTFPPSPSLTPSPSLPPSLPLYFPPPLPPTLLPGIRDPAAADCGQPAALRATGAVGTTPGGSRGTGRPAGKVKGHWSASRIRAERERRTACLSRGQDTGEGRREEGAGQSRNDATQVPYCLD